MATMLQDTLNTYVSQITNIKGMEASVYIPGQGMWTSVTGNSYTGQPITPDMRMGIASNTKLLVATVMLMLAEENVLSLDDSLSDWLPTYPNIDPNITIKQLLNHSSGISDPLFVSPWMDTIMAHPTRIFTPEEVIGWVGAPLFTAGTNFGYSNINYILAGMIAQQATSYPISQLIRDRILNPLNMNTTFYDIQEPENGTIAHRWWNNVDYNDTSRVGLNTAGGCAGAVFSTSADMAQWYQALFNGGLISQASLNQMTTFIPTNSPTYQYGLGLSRETVQGKTYWGHGGATWGYKSKMMQDSCLGVSVCGLANSFPAGIDAVTFLLYRVVKNHIPGCSGAINGTTSICSGTEGVVYSVPSIPNATSYSWTLPSGATGTSTDNTILVNFGAEAISGNIIVRGINNYGAGGYAQLFVTVQQPPNPIIAQNGTVVSFANVCENGIYTYSVPFVNGHSYLWTITGGTIINGQGTNTINVQWNNGTEGAVSLQVSVE
ncbi:MAG: beta-lactamase family protein [Sphingobacteriales bacterium]|nr:beta-lactamase family protein [Sphingobacteriales bacterium]